jgi:hypothetical protein
MNRDKIAGELVRLARDLVARVPLLHSGSHYRVYGNEIQVTFAISAPRYQSISKMASTISSGHKKALKVLKGLESDLRDSAKFKLLDEMSVSSDGYLMFMWYTARIDNSEDVIEVLDKMGFDKL